jgi:hypothetical protein
VDSSPEKAGVGGSIPSLATMFSVAYKPFKQRVGPNWSQNLNPNSLGLVSQAAREAALPNLTGVASKNPLHFRVTVPRRDPCRGRVAPQFPRAVLPTHSLFNRSVESRRLQGFGR